MGLPTKAEAIALIVPSPPPAIITSTSFLAARRARSVRFVPSSAVSIRTVTPRASNNSVTRVRSAAAFSDLAEPLMMQTMFLDGATDDAGALELGKSTSVFGKAHRLVAGPVQRNSADRDQVPQQCPRRNRFCEEDG